MFLFSQNILNLQQFFQFFFVSVFLSDKKTNKIDIFVETPSAGMGMGSSPRMFRSAG